MDENTNMNTANKRLPEAFGDRIAFLRKWKGLTQAQLAEQLGISAQAVSKWESGLSCPDIMMLVPLANLFGVSTDLLLGGGQLTGQEAVPEAHPAQESESTMEQREPEPCGQSTDGGFTEPEDKEPEKQENFSREDEGKTDSARTESTPKEDVLPEKLEIKKVFHENQVNIHSLQIDISMAEAIIREGDEFALDLSGYPNGDCREEVKDGVWKIKDRGYKDLFVLSNLTNLFSERKVVIIIPRGYRFRDVKIKLGAGKLVGRGILAETSCLDLGAGEVILADYYSGPAKIKCGMGKVMLEGRLTGKCKLDCGMGEIAASLTVPSDYGYKVKVGMGDVRVGEDRFGGMGGTYKANVHAENFFDINCGMGSVKVVLDR